VRFKREQNITLNLETLAVTDIVLNLFIFFFITFSFLASFHKLGETQMDINLPRAASTVQPLERRGLVVMITREGGLFLEREAVTLEQLQERFRQALAQGAEVQLIIRADQEVAHGRVVQVMDMAKTAGINRLAIATQPQGS
jgi:biopolymer transport protein ExbD